MAVTKTPEARAWERIPMESKISGVGKALAGHQALENGVAQGGLVPKSQPMPEPGPPLARGGVYGVSRLTAICWIPVAKSWTRSTPAALYLLTRFPLLFT